MSKKAKILQQQKRPCATSRLISKSPLKLSLRKVSDKTKIRDSSFDILIG